MEDEDTDESTTKTRKKPGKRAIYFHCAGNVTLSKDLPSRKLLTGQTALIMEMIEVTKPSDDEVLDITLASQEAKNRFHQMYGSYPEVVGVPVALYKGAQQASKKREALTVSVEKNKCFFLPKVAEGIMTHKGVDWNVSVNFTADPETVMVFFVSPVVANGKKWATPKQDFFSIKQIRDLKEMVQNTDSAN